LVVGHQDKGQDRHADDDAAACKRRDPPGSRRTRTAPGKGEPCACKGDKTREADVDRPERPEAPGGVRP
jgi:hypothetical protein